MSSKSYRPPDESLGALPWREDESFVWVHMQLVAQRLFSVFPDSLQHTRRQAFELVGFGREKRSFYTMFGV